jgi:hypothetical protein
MVVINGLRYLVACSTNKPQVKNRPDPLFVMVNLAFYEAQ